MKFFAGLMLALAQAENIQPQVPWSSCTGYDFCGQLEFCQSGSSFGYRLAGSSGCSYPGPTLRMIPGNKYKLVLSNKASEDTNLHTHGLHISGAGDADDVTRHVSPGMCLSYVYDITSDHSGGTYWYHAHHHGRTNPQVSGGAFGVVIIEDSAIAPNNDVAAWMMNDRILQISKISGTEGNGMSGGDVFNVIRNQWYRFRISAVDSTAKNADLKFDSGCEVRNVAHDGIWRSTVPGSSGLVFPMNGVGRQDLAVRCTANVGSTVGVTFGRKAAATLLVASGSASSATPFNNNQAWAPARPLHLQNLASASVLNANKYALSMSASSVGGYKWPEGIPGTFAFNEVHEWSIGGSGSHPFHLHLYHMQIMSRGGCGDHEEGEFYDTISASGTCVVRFKTADIGERCVLHCHVLGHEDNGAMTYIDVQGSGMPKNTGFAGEEQCGGEPPSCTPTTCVADSECGSTEGTDDCDQPCTLSSAPTCGADFECMANMCDPIACTPTTCTATFACGSASGTDDCGGFCTTSAGSCQFDEECVSNVCDLVATDPPACIVASCTANFECGSTSGTDNCGDSCSASAGLCQSDEECLSNTCEVVATEQCAASGESCQFDPCCPGLGLSCPGGKPSRRICN